jgi:pyrimidine operon attenuation protein/uracil phosphoribosyltransferase
MKTLLETQDIRRALIRIAHEIIERNKGSRNLVFIGIKRRGDFIARRLVDYIKESEGIKLPLGALDITLYRDDLQLVSETPIIEGSNITFDINKKTIILVDDVLFSGRTVRAAIEEILDFGRPKAIQLAVLIDRGHRELPIQADYVGKKVSTAKDEIVDVFIKDLDGDEFVVLHQKNAKKAKKPPKLRARIKMAREASLKIKQLTITDKEKHES